MSRVTGSSPPQRPSSSVSGAMVTLLAVACGLAVANLYYAQPLLHILATDFGSSPGVVATVVTATQVGYAAGLLLLVPLGDLLKRRRLAGVVLVLDGVALAGAALSRNLIVFEVCLLVVGCTSVVAQVLVPLAADLASEERRGRVVGTVMTGLLLGILLARTVSGLLAAWAGWRSVYWTAGVAVVVLAATLWLLLPADRPSVSMGYSALLRSTARMAMEEPVLRQRALLGGLAFAAFSAAWTTLAFLLSGPPYRYGPAVIGLFGLVGAAGALCASFAGRLADRGWERPASIGFALAVAIAFALMLLGRSALAPLLAGIVVLDVGVQGLGITNQSLIYGLRGGARSRLNSVYMTTYFVGGAVGSAAAGLIYAGWGWLGVCAFGLALAAALMAVSSRDPGRGQRTD
ncbi:MAG TPA: MFS transporter [Candidatus Dormibacteraeota bacterium]|nr:MFS transporter [Candidatus Dormibacteraeota bacterium]